MRAVIGYFILMLQFTNRYYVDDFVTVYRIFLFIQLQVYVSSVPLDGK